MLDYETAIYDAMEEGEIALYALAREHERIKHLEVAAKSAKEATDAAFQQYEVGPRILKMFASRYAKSGCLAVLIRKDLRISQ